ncbi:MAG: cyclopropane fatty acyl phospholipid synthase [Nanoarchaeota archaeon]|nr:cyclopropane fatty acyl phospholipid synthase [DPANN group archaeon]MBL7116403.1 cyclopropane fatty acyl phospholipid synthase [Nanoarchaeota archaeon]
MFGNSKQIVQRILSKADVRINGDRPWDIQVFDERLYSRVLAGGSLALGESYMDGWWGCKKLDQFFTKILRAGLDRKVNIHIIWRFIKAKLTNAQRSKAYNIGKRHYDKGNELYKRMLDKGMNYSCGYWKNAKTLYQAQKAKLKLICKKIGLKHGMTVLDIGSGWGGFAKYAAEKYKARVLGITVSKEQAALSKELCKGLPVEIRLQDYRTLNEKFDRIVSIGMVEHVGYKNYRTFMRVVNRCLKPDGIFLLHTIASNLSRTTGDPWMDKYIFPDGMIPSIKQFGKATEGLFVMEDWHNFGADYDKTLMAWHKNFTKNWDKIKDEYDKRFYRMWTYYLLSCAGASRARRNQLWQIVFSKKGVEGGYKSVR